MTRARRHALSLVCLGLLLAGAGLAQAAEPKIVAAFFVDGKVGLKWQPVEGIERYAVYRKGPGGEFEKRTALADDHWFDTEIEAGATYRYKVAAVGSDGVETFSAEKAVVIPAAAGGDFLPPVWSGSRLDQNRIMLNWDPVPAAIAYNIYRSETPGGGYEVVGNSRTTRYADKDGLVRGATYTYVITALNAEFEETAYSEERSVKFGLSADEVADQVAEENRVELETVTLTERFSLTEAGTAGPMNQPADVFLNAAGDLYVTDALNARVHCFDPDGRYRFSFGGKPPSNQTDHPPDGTFLLPFTLFIDERGEVFVGDVNRNDIQVFSADGSFLRRIRVDTGEGMEPLRPNGIHVLPDGRLVVTDTGNHRFLVLDPAGKILRSVGKRGGGPGEFNFPDELTVTRNGMICVVDVINCRVQEFNLQGDFVREFGGIGQSAGTFARPKGIAEDGQGRLWVSDAMSNMIQCFTPEGEVKAAVGTSQDAIRFVSPRGMFFRDGTLYIVSRVANRVSAYRIG